MSSDQFFKSQGNYPQVVVVRGGGPVVEKKISWLTNLLNVGVIEVKTYSFEDIDKIKDDELLIILIPSQDEMEESMCTQLRKKFKAKIWSMNHHKTSTTIEKFFSQEVNALELIKDIHAIVAVL